MNPFGVDPIRLFGDHMKVCSVPALEFDPGLTAFVVQRIGIVTKGTADFTSVFFALAALATFALAVVIFPVRPRWFKIE